VGDDITRILDNPMSVLRAPEIGPSPSGKRTYVLLTKGLNVEAVGDNLVPTPCMEVMNGSFSMCDTTLRKLLAESRAGDAVVAERAKLLRRLDDFGPSSGLMAVNRVSGVPLKDSAPPLDDRGDDGLSFWCAIVE
jgi:hypothetical protein